MRRLLAPVLIAAAVVVGGCGDDGDITTTRADQARRAALDAGLDADVSDFLALAATGQTTTYQVTYPGTEDGTRILVASQGADRRIDLVANGVVTDVQLVVDGEAFGCPRDPDSGTFTCTKTDAFVASPGEFDPAALDALTQSLADAVTDFTFSVETMPIAGVDARCLVTRKRADSDRSDLGASGTLCLSAEGAILQVDRSGDTLTATDYGTDIADNTFVRPDRVETSDDDGGTDGAGTPAPSTTTTTG